MSKSLIVKYVSYKHCLCCEGMSVDMCAAKCVFLLLAVQATWTAHVQFSNTKTITNMLVKSLNSKNSTDMEKTKDSVREEATTTGSSITEVPEVEEAETETEEVETEAEVPHKWFTQRLDHFTPADNRTWKQRYWVRSEQFRPGGPVFLSIGGEWHIQSHHPSSADMEWFTSRHHALGFVLEHRFYGYSRPTSNLSVENLRYLSSAQALEDLAYFIQGMNREYRLPTGTRWVAVGCSYAGSLAAWLRAKHPDLVFAAVASGAPVFAKMDFPEFLDSVDTTLSTARQGCSRAILEANDEFEKSLKTAEGQAMIIDSLGVCGPIDVTNAKDVANIYDSLISLVTNAVQYDDWDPLRNETKVQTICRIMTDPQLGSTLDRYLKMLEEISKPEANCVFDNSTECTNHSYSELVENVRNISWQSISEEDERRVMSVPVEEAPICQEEDEIAGDRQWLYQCCSEFGYFQTSSGRHSLTGGRIPLSFYTQQCADVFGKQFTEEFIQQSISRTNLAYQEVTQSVSRVLFVYGSQDPWAALGVNESTPLGTDSEVLVIPGASHCQEGNEYKDSDPPALQVHRLKVWATVVRWLEGSASSDAQRPSYVFRVSTQSPRVAGG